MSFYQAHHLLCAGYSELFVSGLVIPPPGSDAPEEPLPELPQENPSAPLAEEVDATFHPTLLSAEKDLIISQTLLALEGKRNILPLLEICSLRGKKRRRSRDHSPKRSLTKLFRFSGPSFGDFQFRPIPVT